MGLVNAAGPYEVQSLLLQRPRSSLHRAWDTRHRRPVLLERLDAATPPAALQRYAAVASAVKRANLPGTLAPLEVVTADPAPYAVYLAPDGEPLELRLARPAPLQWAPAADLILRCATTIAAVATATGSIHGRLEPANLWISAADDSILILAFGAAELGPPAPVQRGPELLEYRAPEQLVGAPADARTDVFALAVLLVELSTGVHPFAGSTPFQAAHKLTQSPPDLAELTRGMSQGGAREVAKVLIKALARDPAERYQDAHAFAAALTYVRGLAGAPAPQRPQRAPAPAPAKPTPVPADPTTIQLIPGERRPRPAPVPVSTPAPPPAEPPPAPAPFPPRPRSFEPPEADLATISFRPLRPPVEPTPVDHTERIPSLNVDAARQQRLARQPSPVPSDRTEQLPAIARPRSPVPSDRTEPLPAIARPALTDRTEALPVSISRRAPAPTDRSSEPDEPTTALPSLRPRRVAPDPTPVPRAADTTLLLPDDDAPPPSTVPTLLPPGETTPPRVDTTLLLPEHASPPPSEIPTQLHPEETAAPTSRPLPRALIMVNLVAVVLILLGLVAIVALR